MCYRKILLLTALICLILFAGCATTTTGKFLTVTDINTRGTKIFNASEKNVYIAVKTVLKTRGFEIAFENEEKGVINTERKLIGTFAQAYHTQHQSSVQSRGTYRQYLVNITNNSEDKTSVVFVPKVFVDQTDVSNDNVWVLEGQSGEYALWESIFKEMETML